MSDTKPITGNLRQAMVQWGWADGREVTITDLQPSIDAEPFLTIRGGRFGELCDAIDAIHANLERENAELKAELVRVAEEQKEHAHAMGDSITDELREYAEDWDWLDTGAEIAQDQIEAIADRIDAEHERQLEVLYRDMSDAEYVKLPKDADSEPVRIGDVMEWPTTGETFEVVGIGDGVLFYIEDGSERADWTGASTKRHHKPPTVEDVLREFTDAILEWAGKSGTVAEVGTWSDVAAEYAKRLTLAEGVDA